jgi:hypothetical protein
MVKGSSEPVSLSLGVNTLKTLENSGVKISRDVSQMKLQEILNRYQNSVSEGELK